MSLVPIIFLICLTIGVVYSIYVKRKERELIEQVTSITRGEWSERKVVLKLLKLGITPKAIFHDLYIQKPNVAYGKEKHRFYNPIMQNAGHIQAIRQCLPQNPNIPIYSVIVFFGDSEFKNITCHADNTFIIYPRSIQQVVSEILIHPDANFGNKFEIMNLFTNAVQNGNDPMIVASQINSAAYHGRNTPRSTYVTYFDSLSRFGSFLFRKRF